MPNTHNRPMAPLEQANTRHLSNEQGSRWGENIGEGCKRTHQLVVAVVTQAKKKMSLIIIIIFKIIIINNYNSKKIKNSLLIWSTDSLVYAPSPIAKMDYLSLLYYIIKKRKKSSK